MLRIFLLFLIIPLNLIAIEEYTIIIKNHHFIPDKLVVPKDKKIKILLDNQDNEVEEFESFDLRREKIIPFNSQVTINIGPLDAGEYKFFGDFHSKTAQGIIIAQ
jgi:hypothetical protein